MIPDVSRSAVLAAMQRFDRELRGTREWAGWEENQAPKYAIEEGGYRYPVKQVISMATHFPVSEFSGGNGPGHANPYVRDRGFTVVNLRPRSPKWQRDELILALDLYLRHRAPPPGKGSDEILELSNTLNRLAEYLGIPREGKYLSPNGAYMKLMNFRRFGPEYTRDGRVGLTRGGKDEKAVWAEFADHPARCHEVAEAIRSAIESPGIPSAPMGPEDDAEEAEEGRVLTTLHRRRERNWKLVTAKKAKVMREKGKLVCEVCGFERLG